MKYPRRRRAKIKKLRVFLLVLALGGAVYAMTLVFAGTEVPPRVAADTSEPPVQAVGGPAPEAAPPEDPLLRIPASGEAPLPPASAAPAQIPSSVPESPPLALQPEMADGPMKNLSLEETAKALASLVSGKKPRIWGENLPGVTIRLSPEQVRRAREVAPILTHGAGEATSEAGAASRPVLALTLDLCGGKAGASYDERIIRLLREHGIPATIFVSSLWMRVNGEALADLAADPLFEIAAHGSRHKPCSVSGRSAFGIAGTASLRELVGEVEGNARDISAATGRRPLWFRSGTAHYDEVAVEVLQKLELGIAGYSVAADQGATLPADKVAAKVLGAKSGDILLAHLNKPGSGTYEGLARALPELLRRGAIFVQLSFGGPG